MGAGLGHTGRLLWPTPIPFEVSHTHLNAFVVVGGVAKKPGLTLADRPCLREGRLLTGDSRLGQSRHISRGQERWGTQPARGTNECGWNGDRDMALHRQHREGVWYALPPRPSRGSGDGRAGQGRGAFRPGGAAEHERRGLTRDALPTKLTINAL